MKPQELATAIKKRAWIIVLVVLLAAGAAAVISKVQTPVYKVEIVMTAIPPNNPTTRTPDATISATYIASMHAIASAAESLDVAEAASVRMAEGGIELTPEEILGKIGSDPVVQSSNFKITVSDSSPTRVAEIANIYGETVVQQLSGSQVTMQGTINFTNRAIPPAKPTQPKPLVYLGLAIFVGLVLGFGLVIGLEYFNPHFRSVVETAVSLGLPVLGAIPRERGIEEDALLSHIKANSLTYQAYSELRTNLIFSHEENLNVQGRKANSIVVTPVMPMPRGPYVSINLAASIASTGRRVLLVDCCLREPHASRQLGATGKPGLAEILEKDKDALNVVLPTRYQNLTLLPAGVAQGDPTDLLSLPAFSELLRGLEWKYDQMVLEVPVLGTSVDAALIASVVASCLVVIDFRSCTRTLASQALDSLRLLNIQPTGVILANVKLKGRERLLRSMPTARAGSGTPAMASGAAPGGPEAAASPAGRAAYTPARTIVDEEEYPEGESDNLLAEAVRLGRAGSPLPVNWLTSLISEKPEERDKVVAAFYAYYEAALKRYGIEPQPARKMADEILRMTRREGEYAGMSKAEINDRFKQMLVKAGAKSPHTGSISQF